MNARNRDDSSTVAVQFRLRGNLYDALVRQADHWHSPVATAARILLIQRLEQIAMDGEPGDRQQR